MMSYDVLLHDSPSYFFLQKNFKIDAGVDYVG